MRMKIKENFKYILFLLCLTNLGIASYFLFSLVTTPKTLYCHATTREFAGSDSVFYDIDTALSDGYGRITFKGYVSQPGKEKNYFFFRKNIMKYDIKNNSIIISGANGSTFFSRETNKDILKNYFDNLFLNNTSGIYFIPLENLNMNIGKPVWVTYSPEKIPHSVCISSLN